MSIRVIHADSMTALLFELQLLDVVLQQKVVLEVDPSWPVIKRLAASWIIEDIIEYTLVQR